jgi:hypothetical protein
MEAIRKQLHLDKLWLSKKLTNIVTNFILKAIFFEKSFKCGDGAKF